jgi:hypothetical protein
MPFKSMTTQVVLQSFIYKICLTYLLPGKFVESGGKREVIYMK